MNILKNNWVNPAYNKNAKIFITKSKKIIYNNLSFSHKLNNIRDISIFCRKIKNINNNVS